ncbi:hypothetical protein ABT337_27130 [Saccharopolyspora hirsuta]|uniref:Uncharacterized protein n=1 Tax=Saccharopolyspora hirsuta TaxID=1837 RepID=A0A5M7CA80_SACHI|nr:hypothetical protein [Saccharopolyspora hirsuta]KAA5837108.1 hypothetical protein F1721_04630 [Saccharopolyspora hirsuta]
MSPLDRAVFGFLLVDAVILALVELLFLPSYLGTVQFPITAAVAAVTTPLLVSEAARLSPRRRIAGAPLVLWFLTVLVFGVLGPGGDMVLVGNDWRTLLLIGAGALPSAMMLGIVLGKRARA